MTVLDLGPVYPNHPGTPPSLEVEWAQIEGYRAVYRIGFHSMEVERLPKQLQVDRVMLLQTSGPVWTRRVDIVQRPQPRLVWDKTVYDDLQVGAGLPLTVGHLPVVLPTREQSQAQFAAWRDEIYSAAGVLVSLLDDRVAQRELFEDFLIFEGTEWFGLADKQRNVRNFLPFTITASDEAILQALRATTVPDNVGVAARWYLRGAQTGPAADGIPLFWTALEAIVGAEGRQVVRQVEDALRDVGRDPSDIDPSVGRLFGLRAEIVHQGKADLEPVVEGWYVLERISRVLIRHELGLDISWPDDPGDFSDLADDVQQELKVAHKTVWHGPDEWL